MNIHITTHTWMLGSLPDSIHMKYIRDLTFLYCIYIYIYKTLTTIWEINSLFQRKLQNTSDFSNFNNAIKQIEQISLINRMRSLILVKSNQFAVEGFHFVEINDMRCFLVTI